MITKKRIITAAILTAAICTPSFAATTAVYDIANVGAAGTKLSTDNWVGGDLDNWIVGAAFGDIYARNNNGGDQTITRGNDAGFSYSIPAGTTFVSLEITGRFGAGFVQTGFSFGGTPILGIGGDFNNNNKFFILDGGTRRYESGTNYTGDSIQTIRLDYDLVAGTADLILDPNGSPTTPIDDGIALPSAPDGASLISELEVSHDLSTWSIIATSIYGSPFTLKASGYLLETVSDQVIISPETPLTKNFYRLRVRIDE